MLQSLNFILIYFQKSMPANGFSVYFELYSLVDCIIGRELCLKLSVAYLLPDIISKHYHCTLCIAVQQCIMHYCTLHQSLYMQYPTLYIYLHMHYCTFASLNVHYCTFASLKHALLYFCIIEHALLYFASLNVHYCTLHCFTVAVYKYCIVLYIVWLINDVFLPGCSVKFFNTILFVGSLHRLWTLLWTFGMFMKIWLINS